MGQSGIIGILGLIIKNINNMKFLTTKEEAQGYEFFLQMLMHGLQKDFGIILWLKKKILCLLNTMKEALFG